eukprot:363938-Chlamydomonas_euryale.AAC.1
MRLVRACNRVHAPLSHPPPPHLQLRACAPPPACRRSLEERFQEHAQYRKASALGAQRRRLLALGIEGVDADLDWSILSVLLCLGSRPLDTCLPEVDDGRWTKCGGATHASSTAAADAADAATGPGAGRLAACSSVNAVSMTKCFACSGTDSSATSGEESGGEDASSLSEWTDDASGDDGDCGGDDGVGVRGGERGGGGRGRAFDAPGGGGSAAHGGGGLAAHDGGAAATCRPATAATISPGAGEDVEDLALQTHGTHAAAWLAIAMRGGGGGGAEPTVPSAAKRALLRRPLPGGGGPPAKAAEVRKEDLIWRLGEARLGALQPLARLRPCDCVSDGWLSHQVWRCGWCGRGIAACGCVHASVGMGVSESALGFWCGPRAGAAD